MNGMPSPREAGLRAGLALLLLLGLAVSATFASPRSQRITLPDRTFVPSDGDLAWLAARPAGQPLGALVQFSRHPNAAEKRAMEQRGLHLQQYIGGGAWVASLDDGVRASDLHGAPLRWVGPLLPADRISPALEAGQPVPKWAEADGKRLYAVWFMKQVTEDAAEALLASLGGDAGDYISELHVFQVQADPKIVDRLSHRNEVLWVDYAPPPLTPVNAAVRAAIHADEVQEPPFNLTGDGVSVCVYDGGLVDAGHPDFGGRVIQGEDGTVMDHPTHVAGTLGGGGADLYRGVAPGVSIVSYVYEACSPYCLYNSPQDIWDNYTEAYTQHNTRIFNNSIGANIVLNGYACSWLGNYELTSALLDSAVRGGIGDGVTVLFAAGNERGILSPCGNEYETMSVPGGAKNIITVGASDFNGSIAPFSSWGPTDDGRLKPDVVAPGVNIISAFAGGGHNTLSGTSMATPAVSGVVALLDQAWHEFADTPEPRPATVKAILCNAAEDRGRLGPDYTYGYGLVNTLASVETVVQYRYTEAEVADNGTWERRIYVPPFQDKLKVTLAWSDPPAAPMAASTLINDLDLRLTGPDGDVKYPFVPLPDLPDMPASRGVNTRDVVEQVLVTDPISGEWTVTVEGSDVPVGPQTFSLAATVPLQDGVLAVSGVVRDFDTGEAVEGATIRVENMPQSESIAGDQGRYTLYLHSTSDARMTCTAFGYQPRFGYLLADTDTPLSVCNFNLVQGGTGYVSGVVSLSTGVEVGGAVVRNLSVPGDSTITDSFGRFSFQLPAQRAYTFEASFGTQAERFERYVEDGETYDVDVVLGPATNQVTGPDGYGYIAIENGDNHPLAPDYQWEEIAPPAGGPGTQVPLAEEETPVVLQLPFPFTYYGESFDTITVCENGFFSFGDRSDLPSDEAADYSNSAIPDPDGPPALVAPFWEDFRALATNLSVYHDAGTSRYIVEWYNSRQYPVDGTYETFEVILYDPVVYNTPTGDGKILFQYHQVHDLGNATVGIESPDESHGIQVLYYDNVGNGSRDSAIRPITDSTAILFYRPAGTISGRITLSPPDSSVTVHVAGGGGETACDSAGFFILEHVRPGEVALDVSAEGYESRTRGLSLADGAMMGGVEETLVRLRPPRDLTGAWTGPQSCRLSWQPPDLPPHEIDAFLDRYRIYRNGSWVAEVEATHWEDTGVEDDTPVYWVTALYEGGESDSSNHAAELLGVGDEPLALPLTFAVSRPWPNPFNPVTRLEVALPRTGPLDVTVFDILGRQVEELAGSARYAAGRHTFLWNAGAHASGVYFVRVQTRDHHAVRKVVLLK